MTTRVLNIEARDRQFVALLASLADFTYTEGNAVDPKVVLMSPNVSLYCLDDEAKRAVFVELPSEVDLAKAPFVYQTQYEQANQLIAVPYQAFVRLAQDLPAVDHFILIYSIGRSGSTLLSHTFNELETVLSLSEPDVASQFVHLNKSGRNSTELRTLLDSTVRFLFKPIPFKRPSTCALKFRSQVVQVMDLYQATFLRQRTFSFTAMPSIGQRRSPGFSRMSGFQSINL